MNGVDKLKVVEQNNEQNYIAIFFVFSSIWIDH